MKTIRARLALALVICFALLLTAGGLVIFYAARDNLIDRFDQELRVQAFSIMTATYQKPNRRVEIHFTDRFLREFDDDVRGAFFQLWVKDGDVVKRSDSLEGLDLPRQYGKVRMPVYWNLELPTGEEGRAIGVLYEPRSRDRREENDNFRLILVVASEFKEVTQSLADLRQALLLVGLITLGVTPFLVFFALKRGLGPLRSLADKASTMNADTLTLRFPQEKLPGELMPIVRQLNALMSRLEDSFEQERRFSADVAHELRTPISELRNLAEVSLKWGDSSQTKEIETSLEIALQMERIVTQLLDVARCENDQISITSERFNLRDLVVENWGHFVELADRRRIQSNIKIDEDFEIETDRDRLAGVLGNLIENAVTYSPEESQIDIGLNAETGLLSFSNSSSDLEAEDVEKLFQRFWRKDPARSDEGHSGLGLAVAKAFAKVLGLKLEAKLDEGNRVVFELGDFRRVERLVAETSF